jgi:hypothetical protein
VTGHRWLARRVLSAGRTAAGRRCWGRTGLLGRGVGRRCWGRTRRRKEGDGREKRRRERKREKKKEENKEREIKPRSDAPDDLKIRAVPQIFCLN